MKSIQGGKAPSGLTKGQQEIVQRVMDHVQAELIAVLPELNAGIQTSGSGGSFSCTLDIKPAKKGRFSARVSARVRTPREPLELDMHIASDGQLELGLPPGFDGNASASGGE